MVQPRWQSGGDVYTEVARIVAEIFGVPVSRLTPGTHFVYDLDESLEVAETVIGCEQFFGLTIPDAEAQKLETVGQLAGYIERRLRPGEEVWPRRPGGHRNSSDCH